MQWYWNSGFRVRTLGEDSVRRYRDSLKGLECGPGHQCYHMQDGASLLQKLCYQCMQDGTWVCHKTLTVTVLTAGVQLQPQQALLGFTWELGHWSWVWGYVQEQWTLLTHTRVVGGVTESHVPSRGIYKQFLSQWEGSSLHVQASIPTTGDQTLPLTGLWQLQSK